MIYIPERVFHISVPFIFFSVHEAGAGLSQELLTNPNPGKVDEQENRLHTAVPGWGGL